MSARLSFFILLFWDLVSLAVLLWVVVYHFELLGMVRQLKAEIQYDSSNDYALIILIMPIIHFSMHFLNHHKNSYVSKKSGQIIVVSFLSILILVHLIIFLTESFLNKNGYEACVKSEKHSVVKRGDSWRYYLGGCSQAADD